jgi:hypothetical protein
MQLARHAAAEALAEKASIDQAEPATPEPPKTEPARQPATPVAPTTDDRQPAPGLSTKGLTRISPALLFTRLCACVISIIELECRIAAGAAATAAATFTGGDPRRHTLRRGFGIVLENHEYRGELNRRTEALMNVALTADPDRKRAVHEIFWQICDELGIPIDLATIPDEFINMSQDAEPPATGPP